MSQSHSSFFSPTENGISFLVKYYNSCTMHVGEGFWGVMSKCRHEGQASCKRHGWTLAKSQVNNNAQVDIVRLGEL
jgi:hypothetical protein